MKKFILTCFLTTSLYANSFVYHEVENTNNKVNTLFQSMKKEPHKDQPLEEAKSLSEKSINVLNGNTYKISSTHYANEDEHIIMNNSIYQAHLLGIKYEPQTSTLFHERRHHMAMYIKHMGIQAIISDYTLGAKQDIFFMRLSNLQYNDYAFNQPDCYTLFDMKNLSILFPKDFFLQFSRIGTIDTKRQEDLDFARAMYGQSYTVDASHIDYDKNIGVHTITFETLKDPAHVVCEVIKKVNGKSETYFYGFDTLDAKNPTEYKNLEVFYYPSKETLARVNPIKIENFIVKVLENFRYHDRVFLPLKDLGNGYYIPRNFTRDRSSQKTTKDYLEILLDRADLIELKKLLATSRSLYTDTDLDDFKTRLNQYNEAILGSGNIGKTFFSEKRKFETEEFKNLCTELDSAIKNYKELVIKDPSQSFSLMNVEITDYACGDISYKVIEKTNNGNISTIYKEPLDSFCTNIKTRIQSEFDSDGVLHNFFKTNNLKRDMFTLNQCQILNSKLKNLKFILLTQLDKIAENNIDYLQVFFLKKANMSRQVGTRGHQLYGSHPYDRNPSGGYTFGGRT